MSVPKSYTLISCPSTTCKEAMLMWGPSNGLHCSYVVSEFNLGCITILYAPY